MNKYKFYGNSKFRVGDHIISHKHNRRGTIIDHFEYKDAISKHHVPLELDDGTKHYVLLNEVDHITTVIYKFTGLLSRDGNEIVGPMSPMLMAKEMAKQLDFKLHGLVRLHNPSINTYDHLITLSKYSNTSVYRLFIDMGCEAIPAAVWFSATNELVVSPIYKSELNNMSTHSANVEDPDSIPIMVFSDYTFKDMFNQAHKSDEFKITDNELTRSN